MIKKIVKPVVVKISKHQARRKLCQLRNITSPAANKIADPLAETLNNNISSDEKEFIDRIEEIRRKLSNSSTEISITDYGTGKPNINRSEEECRRGYINDNGFRCM